MYVDQRYYTTEITIKQQNNKQRKKLEMSSDSEVLM